MGLKERPMALWRGRRRLAAQALQRPAYRDGWIAAVAVTARRVARARMIWPPMCPAAFPRAFCCPILAVRRPAAIRWVRNSAVARQEEAASVPVRSRILRPKYGRQGEVLRRRSFAS